ncbi:unnamed protein product [Rangifer tarandus platyrhynchus]|uniref:Uncharacterized protein n=2 Tax=Rangifer tarandus platyrhynchus TaxID=3082113 RepID=A0ACB0F985_RANTA|nr:unnamed protein product [Rangifer tarandus platyrhynchus]CAI9709254.1 unnamed protein product [Rangifer tarandus platyrhynchus]
MPSQPGVTAGASSSLPNPKPRGLLGPQTETHRQAGTPPPQHPRLGKLRLSGLGFKSVGELALQGQVRCRKATCIVPLAGAPPKGLPAACRNPKCPQRVSPLRSGGRHGGAACAGAAPPSARTISLRRFVATPTCRIVLGRQGCCQGQPGRSSFLACRGLLSPARVWRDGGWPGLDASEGAAT